MAEETVAVSELGLVERTERGFEIVHFRDCYNEKCSLQQSSLADYEPPGSSAVWLGADGDPEHQVRMHLKLEQVRALIVILKRWAEEGSFVEEE